MDDDAGMAGLPTEFSGRLPGGARGRRPPPSAQPRGSSSNSIPLHSTAPSGAPPRGGARPPPRGRGGRGREFSAVARSFGGDRGPHPNSTGARHHSSTGIGAYVKPNMLSNPWAEVESAAALPPFVADLPTPPIFR